MRTILVHLNVEVPDDDERSCDEVVTAIEGALEVGSDHESLDGLVITIPLAEEEPLASRKAPLAD